MKKRGIFWCGVLCVTLLFLTGAEVTGAGWEDMEVLKYDFEISTNPPRDQWYAEVEYNSIDNEFMVIWRSSGPIREDCEPGDEDECTGMFHSMEGQRVSPDGTLLGEMIQLIPPNVGYKNGARFAHNMFTNEYVLANPVSPTSNSLEAEILIARINNVGDIQYGPTSLYPAGGGESPLPEVIFNPVRREYLVVYSDRNIYNTYLNLIGFILDENGSPIHGPFPVGNQEGDFYAPDGDYNPDDDTYLIVWEDFRNVADWLEPCDVYGALLDAADGTMIAEIPVIDDFDIGEPEAGDQRVPVIAYNPDKEEFFVVWEVDEQPSVDDSAIRGRFLNSDGSFKGELFTIVDEPRQQHWPDVVYVEEDQKYFVTWNDCRNDGMPAGTGWWLSPAIDVYAKWLDDTGSPVSDEILIAEREGSGESWKQVPRMAYNPVDKRFLIAWYNRYASGGDTPFAGAPSDLKATLYGIPTTTTDQTGCPIQKIYGEYAEEVKLLRDIRDTILDKSPEGKELIKLYYQLGPAVVMMMEDNEELKETVKEMIDGVMGLIAEEAE
ncbi:MAG: CFI-box-CTERM domain-containing protein [Thermodesulfobacteriota bacterium]